MLMLKHVNEINEHTKHIMDWTSIGLVVGSLYQLLPSIAALFSIGWYSIRIWESKTVQGWVKSVKAKYKKHVDAE